MASQYDTIIQNLGIQGLHDVLNAIAELSLGGAVETIAQGDLQNELRRQLKIAPSRSATLIDCFREAAIFGYDDDRRAILLDDPALWAYDAQDYRRQVLIAKLQAADFLEADPETVVVDEPRSKAPANESAFAAQSDVEKASELQPDQPPSPADAPAESPIADTGGFEELHGHTDNASMQVNVGQQESVSPSDSEQSSGKIAEDEVDEQPVDSPKPPPSPRAGYGRGERGRAVPPTMQAQSAEDLLKAAFSSNPAAQPSTPRASVQEPDAPPQPSEANTPPINQPNTEQTRPQWGKQGSRRPTPPTPPARQESQASGTSSTIQDDNAPAPSRPQSGTQTPRPPAAPASGGAGSRSSRLRPGASPSPTPPTPGGDRSARRPGATNSSSDAVPAWASRRAGGSYGRSSAPATGSDESSLNAQLMALLANHQVGRTDLNLDLKTLRALAEEINRYLANLEETGFAGDNSLRVELQSLLDKISQRAQQKDTTEGA